MKFVFQISKSVNFPYIRPISFFFSSKILSAECLPSLMPVLKIEIIEKNFDFNFEAKVGWTSCSKFFSNFILGSWLSLLEVR